MVNGSPQKKRNIRCHKSRYRRGNRKASKATKNDVAKALKSAEKGFKIWKKTPAWERSSKIRKISELMREEKMFWLNG